MARCAVQYCTRWFGGAALGAFLALAGLSASPAASAAGPTQSEIAKAREQFHQGTDLEAANDFAGALSKFETVAAVKMTPQVRFHIARCHHHLGKLLEALGGYKRAAYEVSGAKDPKSAEVARECEAAIADIEPRIPKLTIRRGKGAEAAQVSLDGVALGDSSIDKENPANPGQHTIEFTPASGKTQSRVVDLPEGESKQIVLSVESTPPPALIKKPAAAPSIETPPKGDGESSTVVPWLLVGVGGASLAASGAFFWLRSRALNDLNLNCASNVCPSGMQDTGNKGKTYTLLGNITLGVGAVGVGLGTILLLTNGGSSPPAQHHRATQSSCPRMTVAVGGDSHSAEATLVGTF
jgi:hypothetical protein